MNKQEIEAKIAEITALIERSENLFAKYETAIAKFKMDLLAMEASRDVTHEIIAFQKDNLAAARALLKEDLSDGGHTSLVN